MSDGEQALVLLGHGSRDPSWPEHIERVASKLEAEHKYLGPVRCAYLEHSSPIFSEVIAQLIQQGSKKVTILPMFFGLGKHARSDLPELLNAAERAYPDIKFVMLPSMGEQSMLADWIGSILKVN